MKIIPTIWDRLKEIGYMNEIKNKNENLRQITKNVIFHNIKKGNIFTPGIIKPSISMAVNLDARKRNKYEIETFYPHNPYGLGGFYFANTFKDVKTILKNKKTGIGSIDSEFFGKENKEYLINTKNVSKLFGTINEGDQITMSIPYTEVDAKDNTEIAREKMFILRKNKTAEKLPKFIKFNKSDILRESGNLSEIDYNYDY